MDEEVREKIFEPFFSTGFFGRGLGMASVYGIVKNHDGIVMVDSELGTGTTVRIFLPAIGTGEDIHETIVSKDEMKSAVSEAVSLTVGDEKHVMNMIRYYRRGSGIG